MPVVRQTQDTAEDGDDTAEPRAADDYAATAPCATMRRVRAAAWNGAAQALPLLPHRLLLQ